MCAVCCAAAEGQVRSLLWERRHWLVLDGAGALLRVDLPQVGGMRDQPYYRSCCSAKWLSSSSSWIWVAPLMMPQLTGAETHSVFRHSCR